MSLPISAGALINDNAPFVLLPHVASVPPCATVDDPLRSV